MCWRILLFLLVVTLIAGAAAYYYRVPLLIKAAELWIVNEEPRKADAILVLGGGLGWRPFEAARLYTNGYAPNVLIISVQRDPAVELGLNPPENDLVGAVLESKGVPKEAIVTIGNLSSSTYEDFQAVAGWAKTNKLTDLIIPTDFLHSRRVRWVAERLLAPVGIRTQVIAIDPPDYSRTNWFNREQGVVAFNNEVIKLAFYLQKY